MKASSAVILLSALAAAAPCPECTDHDDAPQLVHIRDTAEGWKTEISRGSSEEYVGEGSPNLVDVVGMAGSKMAIQHDADETSDNEAITKRGSVIEDGRVFCASSRLNSNDTIQKATNCLMNSLIQHPEIARVSQGVSYCRSGNTIVAMCKNNVENRRDGSFTLDPKRIPSYNAAIDSYCDGPYTGKVLLIPTNTTFWRGGIGDDVCAGMSFDGQLGSVKWSLSLDGPRIKVETSKVEN